MNERLIVVVLGMHKSGTSLITDVLHSSGISMVEAYQKDISYDSGSKAERDSTKVINNMILGSDDLFSLAITNKIYIDKSILEKMRETLIRINDTEKDWGFKDPRTCLTYDLWKNLLPKHKVIIVFRSPEEVWTHYWKSPLKKRLRVMRRFFDSWCMHNKNMLNILSGDMADFLVIEYSKFMKSNSELNRLESFLGRPLVDARKRELHRSISFGSVFYSVSKFIYKLRTGVNPDEIYHELQSYLD